MQWKILTICCLNCQFVSRKSSKTQKEIQGYKRLNIAPLVLYMVINSIMVPPLYNNVKYNTLLYPLHLSTLYTLNFIKCQFKNQLTTLIHIKKEDF